MQAAEIHVTLRYLSALRDRTGCRGEELLLAAGSTLQDVFDRLEERYAWKLPAPGVMIILNGRGWNQAPGGSRQELGEGDTLLLAPLVSGG